MDKKSTTMLLRLTCKIVFVTCFVAKCQGQITMAGCNTTKTCYMDPPSCNVGTPECRFFSWKKVDEGELYEFEMSGGTGDGQRYIAMALGIKKAMQDADLYYCDGKAVRTGVLQVLHDPPAYTEMTNGLATKSAATVNGIAQCVFERPASVTKTISNDASKDFDITKDEYYLLGAIGPMNETRIERHNEWKTVTDSTYNFGGSNIIKNLLNDSDCGNTKNCLKYPSGCTVGSSDCRFFSWAEADEGYNFEMSGGIGNGVEYVSFALGTTNSMQDADLYYCDGVTVRSGVIRDHHTPPTYLQNGVSTISARSIDGVAHCSMNRPASVEREISNGETKNFNLKEEDYYFLAAIGEMRGTEVRKHSWTIVTDERVVAFSSVSRVKMLSPCLLGILALMIKRSSDYLTD